MGTASLHLDALGPAWRGLWSKVAPKCGNRNCAKTGNVWRRLHKRTARVLFDGSSYCVDGCLDLTLDLALHHLQPSTKQASSAHRIPLGLLLLSRQQLTPEQLRAGLEAQQQAGRGKLGDWLQTLGFVTEQQVTAAVARQWSCPVLRASPETLSLRRGPEIPFTLLQHFLMFPVDYVQATSTLHLAFGEAVDYRVMYAIEQMIGCRTEPCMTLPSLLREKLQAVAGHRGEREMVFDRVSDVSDFIPIIRSYCTRVSASEVRLVSCGSHLWARLLRSGTHPIDLLLAS